MDARHLESVGGIQDLDVRYSDAAAVGYEELADRDTVDVDSLAIVEEYDWFPVCYGACLDEVVRCDSRPSPTSSVMHDSGVIAGTVRSAWPSASWWPKS